MAKLRSFQRRQTGYLSGVVVRKGTQGSRRDQGNIMRDTAGVEAGARHTNMMGAGICAAWQTMWAS